MMALQPVIRVQSKGVDVVVRQLYHQIILFDNMPISILESF